MNSKKYDHDWSLSVGFKDNEGAKKFIGQLKTNIKDYRYSKRATNTFEQLKKVEIENSVTGSLDIYITEISNLNLDSLNKKVQTDSSLRRFGKDLKVKLHFSSPIQLGNIYNSMLLNNSLVKKVEDNVKTSYAIVEHRLERNPSWSTKEKPAGEKAIWMNPGHEENKDGLGKLVYVKNTQLLLIIELYTIDIGRAHV